ncbi:MAG TPA: metal-dependent hydrolase [Candidatus Acidoferrales bacterium]|nr:metal-dependent hydrolase [Candidatus Acidoferrales bacterium]
MDPVTQLLVAYTLARAARARVASPEMAVFLAAGIAPHLDWLWHLPAPLSQVRAAGTATQSLLGAFVLAALVAAAVWMATRGRAGAAPPARLIGAAAAAASAHILLDLCSTTGIELYWPFHRARISWNLVEGFDVILLAILGLCALLPVLVGLVTEEIGGTRDSRPLRAWPLAALALALLYLGARTMLHQRAEELVATALYQEKAARHWAAYPAGSNPLAWRGVAETDAFLAEVDVPLGPGAQFAPEHAALHYKPEPSPEEQAAAAAPLARAYVALARFPSLTLTASAEGGTQAQLRELGESALQSRRGGWLAVIELDPQSKVVRQELYYDAARVP